MGLLLYAMGCVTGWYFTDAFLKAQREKTIARALHRFKVEGDVAGRQRESREERVKVIPNDAKVAELQAKGRGIRGESWTKQLDVG